MNKKVPKQFRTCLWSYDIKRMNLEKDKEVIITQVLNYGDWEDLKLLYKLYSKKDIKGVVKNRDGDYGLKKFLIFGSLFLTFTFSKDVYF